MSDYLLEWQVKGMVVVVLSMHILRCPVDWDIPGESCRFHVP